jgi:hypothetical protein
MSERQTVAESQSAERVCGGEEEETKEGALRHKRHGIACCPRAVVGQERFQGRDRRPTVEICLRVPTAPPVGWKSAKGSMLEELDLLTTYQDCEMGLHLAGAS